MLKNTPGLIAPNTAVLRNYKVSITIDAKHIEIADSTETNYDSGITNQVAQLCYRAMLAAGFPPAAVSSALGRIAESGGYIAESEREQLIFEGV